jgi:hypothetical protein
MSDRLKHLANLAYWNFGQYYNVCDTLDEFKKLIRDFKIDFTDDEISEAWDAAIQYCKIISK